jgi:predicted amidohydrolase
MVAGGSYPVFDLDFARVGIQTCYDGYFPEPMRALALQGAEVVLWPNSRGGNIEPDLVSASSFFNVVHIAAVNSANGGGSVVHA